jgi:hypothetical protein
MSSRKRLLETVDDGRLHLLHHDTENPTHVIVEELEDCEPIIEAAKRLSDAAPSKEFRHAAFIPHFVMAKATREGWLNDPQAWKRWANDPDNECFRTWKGRL